MMIWLDPLQRESSVVCIDHLCALVRIKRPETVSLDFVGATMFSVLAGGHFSPLAYFAVGPVIPTTHDQPFPLSPCATVGHSIDESCSDRSLIQQVAAALRCHQTVDRENKSHTERAGEREMKMCGLPTAPADGCL